jgi:hypothetical protein
VVQLEGFTPRHARKEARSQEIELGFAQGAGHRGFEQGSHAGDQHPIWRCCSSDRRTARFRDTNLRNPFNEFHRVAFGEVAKYYD